MKPHMRKRFGIWVCGRLTRANVYGIPLFEIPTGHGYTPEQAFKAWKEQM